VWINQKVITTLFQVKKVISLSIETSPTEVILITKQATNSKDLEVMFGKLQKLKLVEKLFMIYLLVSEGKNVEITPIQRKSPLEKGIGKYAKKAKGSRGYKMNK
jgi:hypothetical protein